MKKRWLFVGAFIALLVWCGIDLFGPRSVNIRDFDADEVARLDNAMWRSYYDRERLKLFFQLAELMRTQYDFPFLRSHLVAFRAAKAAFVFKDGKERSDYEKAIPDLVRFYEAIRGVSTTEFDVVKTARLELEWWIVHRDRSNYPPNALEWALAETSAELYGVPADSLMEYARFRADAMVIRDTKAATGGVAEEDWARIEELLGHSCRSLWAVVNSQQQGEDKD